VTSPTEIGTKSLLANYFPAYIPIGDFLNSHTTSYDRIAVIGSEPQTYFYAKRQSVSGHIYTYGMMEPQPYARQMQEEMIADIERNQPKYLVCTRLNFSWAVKPNSDTHILKWTDWYTAKYYHQVCIVHAVDLYDVRYTWEKNFQQHDPASQKIITVYERNDIPY